MTGLPPSHTSDACNDAMQGFITTTDGVVFKWAKKGSAAAAPWVICKKDGGEFKQVSALGLGTLESRTKVPVME